MSCLEILGAIASSIALAQAIQGTLKAVDYLRENSDSRKECNALRKEILMIEYFILQAREQTDPTPPAQRVVGTFTEHPLVSLTTQELEEISEDLNIVVEKYSHSRKSHDPKRYIDKVKWFSEVRKIKELRERALATKRNLHMAITFRVSSMVDRGNVRQEVLFHRVRQQLAYYTHEGRNDPQNLRRLLEGPPPVSDRLATTQQLWEQDLAIRGIPSASTSEENIIDITRPCLTNTAEQGIITAKEETLVSVTTIQPIGSRTCGPGCGCCCHRTRREHNGGTWAKSFLGSWLVRYRAVGGICQGTCGSNSGVEFEYQLPKWLWAGMVSFKSDQGPRLAWSLRPSRIIPYYQDFWPMLKHPSMLRKLISEGFVCFPDDISPNGTNLIHEVLEIGNFECVEVLLKLWENLLPHQGLPRQIGYKVSLIYLRNRNIEYGDPSDTTLKKILSFVRDWDGVHTTRVHKAVKGNSGLTRALQEEPWAIDEPDKYGNAPIDYAVRDNNLEALEHLILAKANIKEHGDTDGVTLLMDAAWHRKEAMMRRLLDHDACRRSMDRGSIFGETALHRAAVRLFPEGVRLLLNAGASTSKPDGTGGTPLHSLARSINPDQRAVDGIVHLLKYYGANIEAKDHFGYTPVTQAIYNRNLTVLRALVDAGASLGTINRYQHNILHGVAIYPDVSIIKFLADQDLSHVDSQHQAVDQVTPLGFLDNLLEIEEWQIAYDIHRADRSVQAAFITFYFNLLTRDLMRHMATLHRLLRSITDRDMSTTSDIIDQLIKKKTDGNDPDLVEWYRGARGYVVDQAWDCLSEIFQEEYEETSEQLERAYIAERKEISAEEMEEFF